ncbi:hypothetical protein [Halarchaeum salinum]|uniref:hypothetical protein n=1 Tax=Halarchaeum salinum TaxID=489912 RepID=UPI0031D089D7
MFPPEFAVKFHFIEAVEEVVDTRWVSNVPLGFAECGFEIGGVAFRHVFEVNGEEWLTFSATVEAKSLAVREDTVVGFQLVHVVEQLVFVRCEVATRRLELVHGGDGLVTVEGNVVRTTVVGERPFAPQVVACAIIAETRVEVFVEEGVLGVLLAHVLVEARSDSVKGVENRRRIRHTYLKSVSHQKYCRVE